ncbi:tetratricopeptide repeat protein [Methylopila henanensis]|uniref:Tetratricopeptide repeat protein n=1 Tax=Methylopila henanensis TaxID=873516 RepID=A0ABW4K8D1_9HYPH
MTSSARAKAGRLIAVATLAAALAGCMADRGVTGSIMPTSASRSVATPETREARLRQMSEKYAAAYQRNPNDAATAFAYGTTLRALGQRAQALAVLESASIKHPQQKQIVGAYGRALVDAGRYQDALNALANAHTPEQPDWRILNAQGAALDQLGRSAEARAYYESALKIAPGEPSVLSNLGLSYALNNDLARAEQTLAMAAQSPKAGESVRANLALVQSLKARAGAGPAKPQKAARPAA